MSDPSIDKLYYKYGSQISSGVAEYLYDRIEDDPLLASYFEHVDMAALREHMADLLCTMTGGPDIYKGQDLATAHENYKINDAVFDRVAGHMASALSEAGIEADDAALIMTAVAEQKGQVVSG